MHAVSLKAQLLRMQSFYCCARKLFAAIGCVKRPQSLSDLSFVDPGMVQCHSQREALQSKIFFETEELVFSDAAPTYLNSVEYARYITL